jgi:fatty acid desaturase
MGACGHVFVHQNTVFRYLLDIFGMCSDNWLITHINHHHMKTNEEEDSDVSEFAPFIIYFRKHKIFNSFPASIYCHFLYAFASFATRIEHILCVFYYNKNYIHRPKLIRLLLIVLQNTIIIFWLLFGNLYRGLILEIAISYLLQLVLKSTHNQIENSPDNLLSSDEWAIRQIKSTTDFLPYKGYWKSCFYGGWLNHQTVHHLFPSVDPEYHDVIMKHLKSLLNEHNLSHIYSIKTLPKLIIGQLINLSTYRELPPQILVRK